MRKAAEEFQSSGSEMAETYAGTPVRHPRLLRIIGAVIGILVFIPVTAEISAHLMYDSVIPKWSQNLYHQFIHRELMGAAYYWAYRPHPYTVFEPNPEYALKDGEKPHTRDAFRYPEMSAEKPAGVFRIAVLGGSVTYQNDTPLLMTYGAYLEEYLNGIFPGKKIEILNAAVGGQNSADGFARFHFKVLDYSPDMVLINFDMNDVWARVFSRDFKNDYRDVRKSMEKLHRPSDRELKWLKRSALLRVLYFKYVLKGTIPNIMELTYQSDSTANYYENFKKSSTSAFQRNMEDIVYIANGRRIEPVLLTTPFEERFYEPDPVAEPYYVLVLGAIEQNKVTREIASREKTPLIDLEKIMPKGKKWFGDVCHTSWAGNRLKAKLVGDALAPMLSEKLEMESVPYDFPVLEEGAQPLARLNR